MSCHDIFVVGAVVASMLGSITYVGLALYFLFESARSDRILFTLLVLFFVEATLWSFHTIQFICHSKHKSEWHLKIMTIPLWDLIFVLGITATALQIFCSLEFTWDVFLDLDVGYQVTLVLICVIVQLKIISAIILTECYHRKFVHGSLAPSDIYLEPNVQKLWPAPTAPSSDSEAPFINESDFQEE